MDDLLHVLNDDPEFGIPFHVEEESEIRFVERKPVGPNTYRPTPRSANALRAELVRLTQEDPSRSRSARSLLLKVEKLRIEMKRPVDEAHHPDFGRYDLAAMSWTANRRPQSSGAE